MSGRGRTGVGDVPVPLTTFVGRRAQILEAAERLGSTRLLTLVGPGGIGKTRLAQQVAVRIRRTSPATVVRWVRLTELDRDADTTILEQTVADACDAKDFSDRPPWGALVESLREGRHLLVLDNCEHLAEAVGALISDLLNAVPHLRIMATSRQPLGCEGEQQLPVPPLSSDEAWELLADRASGAGVTVPDSSRSLGVQLGQRLDGIPLAIELAAQRLRGMSPEDLLAAMDDRLRLLTGGSRHGGHTTHSSLRAMVEWSWDLCTPAEQTLWARCSVFAGWDLSAAQEVCADKDADKTIQGQDILSLLDGLVDKHIVVADTTRSRTRYRMLETLRLYGQEAVGRRTDENDLRSRHAHYHFAQTTEAVRLWFSPSELGWLEWAEVNMANLRQTFEHLLVTAGCAITALAFAANLTRLRIWFFAGSPREGHDWLERALAAVFADQPNPTDPDTITQLITGLVLAGWIALCQGRPAEDYLAACRKLVDDGPLPPPVAFLQGAHLLLVHADPRGIELLGAARRGFKAAGREFRGDEAMAELIEALAASFTGTREQALEITQRCLDHALAACAPWATSWARLVRGVALTWHGAPEKAIVLERDTLRWGRTASDRWGTVWALHAMAWALAEQLASTDAPSESAKRIAYLLGGADRLRQRTGVALPGLRPFAEATARASTAAQAVLDADTYTAAYDPGLAAEPDAVLAIAVGEPRDLGRRSSEPRPPEPWDVLTPAEQQVAQLAAEGLSNPQIAVRRGVSLRTVETQMTSILRGLAIGTRHEIAAMIPSTARAEEP